MTKIIYILMAFPSVVLNFGLGNIPIRYLGNIFLFKNIIKRVPKYAFYFLILFFIHILYIVIGETIGNRVFNLIDISYLLNYIFIFIAIDIVYRKPEKFISFMYIFTIINLFWAFFQNILLIIGINDLNILMLFSNIKSNTYTIPPSAYIGQFGFYRYSGLFHESAPFVIFLMLSHFLFTYIEYKKNLKNIILFTILVSGAKVGFLYIIINLLINIFSFLKIKIIYIFSFLLISVIFTLSALKSYLLTTINGSGVGSIYTRFSDLFNTFMEFSDSITNILLGIGFLPSSATMGANRGLDFISVYFVSNGIIGTLILTAPYILIIKKANTYMSLKEQNVITTSLLLALLASGSLLIIQYTYFLLILIVLIKLRGKNK